MSTQISFAQNAIDFNNLYQLYLNQEPLALPPNIQLMNPFTSGVAKQLSELFYHAFYQDQQPRTLILGINPGRHGAGLTGIPFTDTKHLVDLGLDPMGVETREISAVFIYKLIHKYGGAKKFYRQFYINSPLPLGLLQLNNKGHWVNANYYDSKLLIDTCLPAIEQCFHLLTQMPINREVCYCFGQGQNFKFLNQFNKTHCYFNKIEPLPHPRYIMQYKTKQLEHYVTSISELLARA